MKSFLAALALGLIVLFFTGNIVATLIIAFLVFVIL